MAFECYMWFKIEKQFKNIFLVFMVIINLNLLNAFVFLRKDFVKNYISSHYEQME